MIPDFLLGLASTVSHNLQHEHDWSQLTTHQAYDASKHLQRPLISGLPPKCIYIHPDEQVAMLKAEREGVEAPEKTPEIEYVLAVHLEEKLTMRTLAGAFDSLPSQPSPRIKRIVLATVHDDSTVVYYLIHEGTVKPRQN